MTHIGDMVRALIAAGASPDVAAVVVAEAYAAGVAAGTLSADKTDISADRRREKDRERKRRVRGHSAESADIPQMSAPALTLKKDKLKSKSRKHPLSADWKPSEVHFTKAAELNIPRSAVEAKAEDMRIWAGSTAALKADWDLTFHGFLRRDAPKLAVTPRAGPMLTITPSDRSWNAWKSHFRDAGQNGRAAIMDKCASDGKPFTVQSEWPPGMAA
jgi:hypothetical protein